MAHFSPSGGMYWHPYQSTNANPNTPWYLANLRHKLGKAPRGSWRHNPWQVAWRNAKGAGLAAAVGGMSYYTSRYRVHPTIGGLQTFTHKRRAPPPAGASAPKALMVDIPGVSSRRTKNILLRTTKPMAYSSSFKRSVKKAVASYKKKGYYKKKATNRINKKKYKARPKGAVKVLKKQVKALQKAVNVDKALHTFKQADCSVLKSLVGRCNHTSINGVVTTGLETACTNIRFYDPAVPGTLVTANQNTGTFARDVFFKDYRVKLVLRNNYQVTAKVKVYLCKVKNESDNSALHAYTEALTDQVITASTDETDQLMHLTDVERVLENWSVDCVLDKTLEPGREMTTSYSTGSINFDPSHIDTNAHYFQKIYKCYCYIIRVEGVLGHDAIANEQSIMPAAVDIMIYRKAIIEYDAGVSLNDIYIQENRIQTFTNGTTTGGVVSLKPVADNIGYSIA